MNTSIEDIKTVFELFNKSKIERKGYILLPTINGFDLFEIDESRLKLYLKVESMNKAIIGKEETK